MIALSVRDIIASLVFIIVFSFVSVKTFSILSGKIVPQTMYVAATLGAGFLFLMIVLFLAALRAR